ncbi:DUF4840 domain-containing protein [Chryseobacterium oryctis]|uniref:DUF4840 domain-containing protein n=1 Tax=Chryseobacterium oryctis TaxID=2952618 RepID=A0ABT3HLD6_9FLAO|nr:DUF4840 domain-containing protein [Chryseobacterium oryctis]MCW3160607.1 DUF4840 domain-containing protein [Chryseobacterium oryctis]
MKKLFVLKAFVIAFIALLGLSLTSCNDDKYEPIPVKIGDENGKYRAKLITKQGNNRTEKIIDFVAKDSVITYKEFPVKEIVMTVLEDEAKTNVALDAMGDIEYKLDFTPKLLAEQNVIELELEPKVMTLQIPVDGQTKTAVVTFTANEKGYYVGQDFSMRYGFVADKITVDGADLTPFEKIEYSFPYSLKY